MAGYHKRVEDSQSRLMVERARRENYGVATLTSPIAFSGQRVSLPCFAVNGKPSKALYHPVLLNKGAERLSLLSPAPVLVENRLLQGVCC